MEDFDEFLDQFLEPEYPPRRNGNPLLIPRAGGDRVEYTRASALADYLEDFSFLWKWKMRGAAKGLADRMDLVRLVAAEDYTTGFAEDEAANRAAGRRIDAVIERAMDHSGTDMKADYGTAIHARTEPGNDGVDPDEKQDNDVESCWSLWAQMGVVHLGTEVFTACDVTRSAGTFDHLSYIPGLGIVVTDKKTSSKAKQNYDVQLGGYANSDVYNARTDQRLTLEEYVSSLGWNPGLINRSVGIIWWVKGGKTEARRLDLVNGWAWAQAAAKIRDQRRPQAARVAKNVTRDLIDMTTQMRATLLDDLRQGDRDHAFYLWSRPEVRAIWTEEHSRAAQEAS